MGPFVDVGDGFTPQTDIGDPGTNLAGVDEAELLKHNGADTVDLIAGNNLWAAITGCRGWYNLTLSGADTNEEGLLDIVIQDDSDCLPVHKQFMVLSQAAYDSKYAPKDSGHMSVNVHAVDDNTTAATNLKVAGQSYSAARGFTGTALPDVSAGEDGGVPLQGGAIPNANADAAGGLPATTKITDARLDVLTDWIDEGRLDLLLDAVLEDTNELQTNQGNWATATGFSTHTPADVAGTVWDEVLTGNTHNDPTSAGRRLRLAEDTTVLLDGTATAGGANTIQLQEGASADDNSYRYTLIVLTGGTGAGQARHVESYNGGTRTITVDREWVTNPDDTTEYALYPWSRTHVHVLGSGATVAASFAANSLDAATFAANSLDGKGDWNTVKPATEAQLNARTLPADGYATKAICSEVRLAQLDATNLPADIGEIPTTKTGYKLASDGLDAVATTAPAGVAGNFREMMVQLFRRFFKKSTLTSTELKTYADNGTDVLTTQAVSDDGTTQTQEASS